jgi:hypothetical protein
MHVPVSAPMIPEWYREKHKMWETTAMMKCGTRLNRKTCSGGGCTQKSKYFCETCDGSKKGFYCKDGQIRGNARARYSSMGPEHIAEAYLQSGHAGEAFRQSFRHGVKLEHPSLLQENYEKVRYINLLLTFTTKCCCIRVYLFKMVPGYYFWYTFYVAYGTLNSTEFQLSLSHGPKSVKLQEKEQSHRGKHHTKWRRHRCRLLQIHT